MITEIIKEAKLTGAKDERLPYPIGNDPISKADSSLPGDWKQRGLWIGLGGCTCSACTSFKSGKGVGRREAVSKWFWMMVLGIKHQEISVSR